MAEQREDPVAGARRVGKSWYRRGLEAGDRLVMRMRGAFSMRGARPRVAAAVTAEFPLYFHTFAYQELLALHEDIGADVGVFHLLDGDPATIDDSFHYLWRNRNHLPNAREIWAADFAHYRRAMPGRVDALLAALSASSDLSADEVAADEAFQRAFTFTRRVELWQPDYIHTYFFYAESLGGLVAQWLLGVPRGVTAYADHILDDWPLKVVPLHLATADLVVATSRRVRDELIWKSDVAADDIGAEILVKPNGVDGRRFPFAERRVRDADSLELISVSRLEQKKGLLELVDVAAECQRRGLPVRFHVVGGVDPGRPDSVAYAEQLSVKIEDLGVTGLFSMHGRRSQQELVPMLRDVDAFVAPYIETESGDKDGIPTAILEAMSSGLAIVATNAGSITEVVADGVEGRIVAQRDALAMADVLAELVGDPVLAPRMGRHAHERFEREFDARVTERVLHRRLSLLLAP